MRDPNDFPVFALGDQPENQWLSRLQSGKYLPLCIDPLSGAPESLFFAGRLLHVRNTDLDEVSVL